tara:strand:+ start:106 stop:447 length:342 start_codon:yes stop_codon:yes gene_type:complete
MRSTDSYPGARGAGHAPAGSRSRSRTAAIKELLLAAAKARHGAAFRLRSMLLRQDQRVTFVGKGADETRTLVLVSQLGEGGYSTVWRAIERQPDGRTQELAIKRVISSVCDDD